MQRLGSGARPQGNVWEFRQAEPGRQKKEKMRSN